MAVNLKVLEPLTTAATALAGLVLVSPQSTIGYQPQNPDNQDGSAAVTLPPPKAFVFHYEGENSAQLDSDITDHFVEDNTAVEDQIALKPELVTVHGFIGELNDIVPKALAPLKLAADKLTTVVAYEPELTIAAQIAYTEAFFLYQVGADVLNSAVAAWSSVTGQDGLSVIDEAGLTAQLNQSKQQEMFQQLYGYWRSRRLFTVQTPWAVFQNMAILKIRAVQEADTRMISDYEVTFKMIRKAKTIVESSTVKQGRANSQASPLVDQGTSTPSDETSVDSGIASTVGGT